MVLRMNMVENQNCLIVFSESFRHWILKSLISGLVADTRSQAEGHMGD
jgi:hypothetical protein